MPLTYTPITDKRQGILVVSHERSGTHFLMNTLAKNFDYLAWPWCDIDYNLNINLFSSNALGKYFQQKQQQPTLNILKSHHHFSFFRQIITQIAKELYIFYIVRDPRAVMPSFCQFLRAFPHCEGPKCDNLTDFLSAEPCGAMMRYQMRQYSSIIARWNDHVSGWLNYIERQSPARVFLLTYEELDQHFATTVEKIGQYLQQPLTNTPVRPEKGVNIAKPPEYIHPIPPIELGPLTAAEETLIIEGAGDTMRRLGY